MTGLARYICSHVPRSPVTELLIILKSSKTRRVRKQRARSNSAMECVGFWKDFKMPTAKRRRRVTFSGPLPVRLRSSSSFPSRRSCTRSMAQCPRLIARRRRGLVRRATRDPERDLARVRAGLFLEGFPLDQKHLADMREVEVAIERRAAPDTAGFDAAMLGWRTLDEVGGAPRREMHGDVRCQRRLVALDREVVMRLPLDQVACQWALGQQGIAAQGTHKDSLGRISVGTVAVPGASIPVRQPQFDPVGRPIHGAVEA